ncbi:MAG: putative metalloprotease CJM1_0395 family protein [Pseudomonadales bacterium]
MNISSLPQVSGYTPLAGGAQAPPTAEEAGKQQALPPVEKASDSAAAADKQKQTGSDSDRQAKRAELVKEQRDQAIVEQLKARDREVRAHEAAHAAVGGQYAGAPTYTYQRGPNGVSYAVGGEVSISTSEIAGDPEATLQKALQVQRAALAPAEPSAQDRKVAAQASQMAAQARIDLAELMRAEQTGEVEPGANAKAEPSDPADNVNTSDEVAAADDSSTAQNELSKRFAAVGKDQQQTSGQLLDQFI